MFGLTLHKSIDDKEYGEGVQFQPKSPTKHAWFSFFTITLQ